MLKAPKLDRIDVNILAELQKSGRMTNAQLADKVGLSPSPCLARVKRLEDAGYITGYGANINLAKLGAIEAALRAQLDPANEQRAAALSALSRGLSRAATGNA